MIKRTLLALGLATLLGGCGFQLRGTAATDFALHEIDLQARNSYGKTAQQLTEVLQNNGVRVHAGAPFRLELVRETSRQRAASFTSSARTAENELLTRLDYEFRDRNGLLLLADSIEVQKIYVQDGNNLVGASQEAEQLRQEMRRDMLQQMALRLQRVTPEQLQRLQARAEAKARAEAQAREAATRLPEAQPQQSPVELFRP